MKIKDLLFKSPTEQINNEIDSYRLLYEPFFMMLFLCFICLCNHILWGAYGCIALFYLIAYEFSMIRIGILSRKCPFKEIMNVDLKERFCSIGYGSENLSSYPSAFLRCGCAYKKKVLFSGSVDKIPFVCEGLGIDKKGNSVSSINVMDAPDYGFSVKIKLSKKAEGKVLVLPRHILFFHPFQSIKDMYRFKSKSKLDKKYLFWQSSTSNFPKQVLVEFLSKLDEIFPLYKIGVSLKDDVMVITLQSVFIKNEQIGTKDLLDFVEQTICAVKDMQEDVYYLEIWPQVKIRKNIAYIISDICILLFFLFFVFVILVSWFSF